MKKGKPKMKPCPICGFDSIKVIYYGLPFNLCLDDECNCLFGFFDWLLDKIPFDGALMMYNCSYWTALYKWIFKKYDVED